MERGSRLKEPTKTVRRSNTAAFVCRAAVDLPLSQVHSLLMNPAEGCISKSSTPQRNNSLRYLAYPACTIATSVEASELVRIRTRTPRAVRSQSDFTPLEPGTR